MKLALALIPVAYLLGTFPSAVMVARSRGVDITTVGSHNPGSSNVARVLGARWGVVVFVLDALKGAIPALVGLLIDSRAASYPLIAAAIVGHMFPVIRHFHGGKGAATLGGAMLVMFPLLSVGLLAGWVIVRRVTRTASIGTLLALAGLIVGVALLGAPAWEIIWVCVICAVVLGKHAGNIKRLIGGSELRASSRG